MFARIAFLLLACSLANADVILDVYPDSLQARPGESFSLYGTVTNTGDQTLYYVGSGFCCLGMVVASADFNPSGPDPLLPGTAPQFLLATFTLAPDAPLGTFQFTGSVYYTPTPFVCDPGCSPISDQFEVEVVPEPSTALLIGSAIAFGSPYFRKLRGRSRGGKQNYVQ